MQINWTKEIPDELFINLQQSLLKDFNIKCSLSDNHKTIVFEQELTFPLQRFCEGVVVGYFINSRS